MVQPVRARPNGYDRALAMTKIPLAQTPLAVYLHWPYCARICPYCDFNVHLNRREGEADALIKAMRADLRAWRDCTGARALSSIHFGGGTPSLLRPAHLAALRSDIETLWPDRLSERAPEIAIEANPNDITPERLQRWAKSGINRLSVGVQSFDDEVLSRLGRDHDGAQAAAALRQAVRDIPSVSADLIFGVAGEPKDRLERDLDQLLALGVSHISAYQLTIEPGTAFAKAEDRGESRAHDADQSVESFDLIETRLRAAGFDHYEVSNYAKIGHRSQHNLAYWRGWDYVGVGPGAHGRLWEGDRRIATEAALRPQNYIEAVTRTGNGVTDRTALSGVEAAQEYVMMGLRINEGVSLTHLQALTGQPINVDPDLIEGGWLILTGDALRATDQGRRVLDTLTRTLLMAE